MTNWSTQVPTRQAASTPSGDGEQHGDGHRQHRQRQGRFHPLQDHRADRHAIEDRRTRDRRAASCQIHCTNCSTNGRSNPSDVRTRAMSSGEALSPAMTAAGVPVAEVQHQDTTTATTSMIGMVAPRRRRMIRNMAVRILGLVYVPVDRLSCRQHAGDVSCGTRQVGRTARTAHRAPRHRPGAGFPRSWHAAWSDRLFARPGGHHLLQFRIASPTGIRPLAFRVEPALDTGIATSGPPWVVMNRFHPPLSGGSRRVRRAVIVLQSAHLHVDRDSGLAQAGDEHSGRRIVLWSVGRLQHHDLLSWARNRPGPEAPSPSHSPALRIGSDPTSVSLSEWHRK